MRRLAKLLPYLAVLGLLLIAVLVVLRYGPLADHLRNAIAVELSRELERPVHISRASFSLTGRVVLYDMLVRDRDGSAMLTVPQATVRLGRPGNRLPFLSAPTEVRDITLLRPSATLTRAADGEWTISDLIAREPERPPRFRGQVVVREGRLTIVDHRAGATTRLESLDLSVSYPRPGRAVFRASAVGEDGAFDSLTVRGHSEGGGAVVSGRVSNLDLAYGMERLPDFGVLSISAGRADLEGRLTLGQGSESAISYDLEGEVRDAEVSFPWLRRPAQGVSGRLELAGGELRLINLRGSVADAPVEVSGAIRNLPEADLDLEVSATGIRYPQIQALFPRLALPAGLLLPSPLRVTARVNGAASDPVVEGQATVRVVRFRLVPWHDVVGRFHYSQGQLRITGLRATGSPRRIEADLVLDLTKDPLHTEASVHLTEVPLELLAQMAGLHLPGVHGLATITAQVESRHVAPTVRGRAVIREVSVAGVPLGELSADFLYSDQSLSISNGSVSGPTARGSFAGAVELPAHYRAEANLSTVDLSALGRALGWPTLTGAVPAALRASGDLRATSAAASLTLGEGEVLGRALGELRAEVALSPTTLQVSNLILHLGGGEYRGALRAANWRGEPARVGLEGRFSVAHGSPADWLEGEYAHLLQHITVSGDAVEISGTLADPILAVDLALHTPSPIHTGRLQAHYQGGRLVLQDVHLHDQHTYLLATGDYSVPDGLDITIIGRPIALETFAPALRALPGLELSGALDLQVRLTGQPADARAGFHLRSTSLVLNQVPVSLFQVAGRLEGGGVMLEDGLLEIADGRLPFSGHLSLPLSDVEARARLGELDLTTLALIGYRALINLHNAGVPVPHLEAYWAIPWPLRGRLSGDLELTRRGNEPPELRAGFAVRDLYFSREHISSLEGDISLSPQRLQIHHLQAIHQAATVSLNGRFGPRGGLELSVATDNLDLSLLGPWLAYAGLANDTRLAGRAAINFDITGTTAHPILERGDLFMEHARLGPLALENITAGPIRVEEGALSIERFHLLGYEPTETPEEPLRATGTLSVPLRPSLRARPAGQLHLRNAHLAPLADSPAVNFDADLYLKPDLLGSRLLVAQEPDAPELGPELPGIRGTVGRGSFAIWGDVLVRALPPAEWHRNHFNLTCSLDGVELHIRDFVSARLDGALRLITSEAGGPVLETPDSQPIIISHANFGLPRELPSMSSAPDFPFAPRVDVRIIVGPEVWFRLGPEVRTTRFLIRPAEPPPARAATGYLDIGGRLHRDALTLDGRVESERGQLAFPNGLLVVRSGTAWVTWHEPASPPRDADDLPTITIAAEAHGRVGDYVIELNPTGQIYPPGGPPLQLNAASIPYLDQIYLMALLAGPMVAPTPSGRTQDFGDLLAHPGRSPGAAGEITGFMLPPFGSALGLHQVTLDFPLEGPVLLRLGERFFDRLVISYLSPLSGPTQSQTLRVTYEVRPTLHLGFSVNELDRTRYEIQSFIPF